MRFVVCRNAYQVSDVVFNLVADQLKKKPSSVFLLSSGSSPLGLYKRLVRAHEKGKLDFSKAVFFNLDEYLDCSEYSDSYHFFFHHHLFSLINAQKKNLLLWNPHSLDPEKELLKMHVLLKEFPVDLAILGIGQNGHVAFNEPGSLLNSHVRVVSLSQKTRLDNARFFSSIEAVPKKAFSFGLSEILKSKRVVLLATGTEKAPAVSAMLDRPVSTACPASVLSRHPDAWVIADSLAASLTRFASSGLPADEMDLWNFFNLPRTKKIVVLSSRLPDASMFCGGLLRSLSPKNAVFGIVLEESGATESTRLLEKEALSNGHALGLRCLFVRSKQSKKLSSTKKADEKKLLRLLDSLAPDIVLVPNRFHCGASDRLVRKIGVSWTKRHARSCLWSFESDRGLFEPGSASAAFEFGVDVMLQKYLAIRKLRSFVIAARIDLESKNLSVFRRISLYEWLSESLLLPMHLAAFAELFLVEKTGKGN